jgi:uncharacterized membrane-anchored protein YhcB (DUF1043 family)
MGAVLTVLAVSLVCFGAPVFGQEQTDAEKKIEELEKQLQQIKDSLSDGDDVAARIEALEKEFAKLKEEMASASPGEVGVSAAKAPTAQADASSASDQDATAAKQLPRSGMQGAPNPLQDDHRYLTGKDLLDDSFPNSIPIPGTDARFAIRGYAKLDFIQDLDYVGDRFEFELATIPVEGTPEAALDGRTTLHAKESRIGFDFRTTARNEKHGWEFPLQAFLEIDFFEDREELSRQPRLRHAYGVVGRFLAGQTWTISADLEALPGLIDFADGDALYGNRAAQIRWQDRAGEKLTWAVGLENPDSEIGNPLGFDGANRITLPNLAGRLRWKNKGGSHFQVAGDLYQLNWQGGETGPSDSALGWGVNLTGRYLFGKGNRDAIMGGAVIGKGAAHRIVSLGGSGSSGVLTASGNIDVLPVWEANIGISHYWTDSLNSTFSTAWTELDNSVFQPGDAIHRAGSFHLNLIWFPYKLASTGFEIMWGIRENKDGAEGTAFRIQYMAKFKFN